MKDKQPNPRRDRAREIARTIGKMSDEERQAFAARAPVATVDGRILSLKNIGLAAMQKPDVTDRRRIPPVDCGRPQTAELVATPAAIAA